jgi:hypothetical protein
MGIGEMANNGINMSIEDAIQEKYTKSVNTKQAKSEINNGYIILQARMIDSRDIGKSGCYGCRAAKK